MAAEHDSGKMEKAVQAGAPHGITLFDHAELSAEIAEGDRSTAEVLAARDLTEPQWNESTIHWMTRMGDDAREHGQHARVAQVYSEAFSKAQDARKLVPPMDAAAYAKLVVDIQLAGGTTRPLAVRGLSSADYLRLSRHWARELSTNPEQSRLFFETYQALQPATESEP